MQEPEGGGEVPNSEKCFRGAAAESQHLVGEKPGGEGRGANSPFLIFPLGRRRELGNGGE